MTSERTGRGLDRGVDLFLRGVGAISTFCGWIAAGMILASVLITCQRPIGNELSEFSRL